MRQEPAAMQGRTADCGDPASDSFMLTASTAATPQRPQTRLPQSVSGY